MNDLYSLLPHSRKDAKLDTKSKLHQLNELADLYNCNNVLFLEARKGKDLYAWISKPPNGPTLKLHLQNLHTMEELHFSGNCLRGSRPVLSFDANFDSQPHWRLIRELLTHTFGVPKTSRKIKPFVDHVMGFTIAGGRIWVRCYEIKETEAGGANTSADIDGSSKNKKQKKDSVGADDNDGGDDDDDVGALGKGRGKDPNISLIEIGPRFVLTPIVILESSFGGPVIYENKEFVSPNQVRAEMRLARAGRFSRRDDKAQDRKVRRAEMGLASEGGRKKERDALDNRVLFA
jgi:ribosome biogenesis protein BRX1